jgi:hypothetical protein
VHVLRVGGLNVHLHADKPLVPLCDEARGLFVRRLIGGDCERRHGHGGGDGVKDDASLPPLHVTHINMDVFESWMEEVRQEDRERMILKREKAEQIKTKALSITIVMHIKIAQKKTNKIGGYVFDGSDMITNAWQSKRQQILSKAKFTFKDDPDLLKELAFYQQANLKNGSNNTGCLGLFNPFVFLIKLAENMQGKK